MTPTEIDNLPDYTDAQLLKLYRYAFAQGWWGQSKSIDGRMWNFGSRKELLEIIDELQRRVDADDDEDNNGTALVVLGSPR